MQKQMQRLYNSETNPQVITTSSAMVEQTIGVSQSSLEDGLIRDTSSSIGNQTVSESNADALNQL